MSRQIVITGWIGLFAAIFTGVGEFLLHYDALSRYSESSYTYMLGGSNHRETLGHFFAVFAAPFYLIGCWHIYLMLKPAHSRLALAAFFIAAYGFVIGGDWISSRASIGAIIHLEQTGLELNSLVELYRLRYENLLTVVRVTTLILSLVIAGLALSGRSYYQKWTALLNPLVLLLLNFVLYAIWPQVGKYLMPIALNVGFALFFALSLLQYAIYQKRNNNEI